jgi:hypothetical protein
MDDKTYHALEQFLGGIVTVQEARAKGVLEENIQRVEDKIKDPKLVMIIHSLLSAWGLNLRTVDVNPEKEKLHIKTDMWPDVLEDLIIGLSLNNVGVYYTNIPNKWCSTIVIGYKDVSTALDLINEYTDTICQGYEVDIDSLPLKYEK